MSAQPARMNGLPHVVVVGNEKGGSGKTTIAMHLAVALQQAGQRVATIDLDGRQKSLTRYVENRRAWAARNNLPLVLPHHCTVARAEGSSAADNERAEFVAFDRILSEIQHEHDFVIIDTPPSDCYLTRLAHAMTDTLVTPLNDSFLDLDALARIDPVDFSVTGVSHYADMVREARRGRRLVDGVLIDWVVLPNRLTSIGAQNRRRMDRALAELSVMLSFRVAEGLTERLVYREYVARGLTALDEGSEPMPRARARRARQEVGNLLAALRLPMTDRGRNRAAMRAEWFKSRHKPLELDSLLLPSPA